MQSFFKFNSQHLKNLEEKGGKLSFSEGNTKSCSSTEGGLVPKAYHCYLTRVPCHIGAGGHGGYCGLLSGSLLCVELGTWCDVSH